MLKKTQAKKDRIRQLYSDVEKKKQIANKLFATLSKHSQSSPRHYVKLLCLYWEAGFSTPLESSVFRAVIKEVGLRLTGKKDDLQRTLVPTKAVKATNPNLRGIVLFTEDHKVRRVELYDDLMVDIDKSVKVKTALVGMDLNELDSKLADL